MRRLIERDPEEITVFIWLNSEFFEHKGHVALQTYRGGPEGTGRYISFWPPGQNDDKYTKEKGYLVDSYEGARFRTYKYDRLKVNWGQLPDYTIHLKGFDIDKINEEFDRILAEKIPFDIYGSIHFIRIFNNSANCTEIVYRLLRKGGLPSELNRFLRYSIGTGICSITSFPIGGLSAEIVAKIRGQNLNTFSTANFIWPISWLCGLYLSHSSQYKGNIIAPILSSTVGVWVSYVLATIDDDTRLLLLLLSMPISLSLNWIPSDFPSRILMKDPGTIYRLTSSLPKSTVYQPKQNRASFFSRTSSLIMHNKVAVASTAVIVGIATYTVFEKRTDISYDIF